MQQSEGRIQPVIFLGRWLLAPFLAGLFCCILLLLYRFFVDLYQLAKVLPDTGWHDLVIGVLNLMDVALTANLVLIVIFSGYENFIQRIARSAHRELPYGLTETSFSALKQKILGTIVTIAVIDALAWYLELEKYTDTTKLTWAIAFPLMFVVSMVLLAVSDRLGHEPNNKVE